jgi:hypothetical protein
MVPESTPTDSNGTTSDQNGTTTGVVQPGETAEKPSISSGGTTTRQKLRPSVSRESETKTGQKKCRLQIGKSKLNFGLFDTT